MNYKKFRNSKIVKFMYDKGVLYFCLSFIIPVIIMLLAFRKEGIHPFGSNQMLVVDLWHQYYPFFRVVREKLATGGSFLYSWQNGMGTNFLSLISYYAASPLNWISVFFDDEHVRDAMMYILVAKIGFSGAFFSCFLRYTFKRRDLSIVAFSCMFALCSYTLGYYWNVMWFDTIALFPLVMLGVTAMCREKKWKLYTVSLALSLFSNYYIGFFTCIFTIFMFMGSAVIEWKGIKDFFAKLWIIVRSSIIGIGLSAFMLLPAYFGLKLTHSADNTFPVKISWYEDWSAIFANLISYSEPTHIEGLPNFACGMLAVVLFGVFIFSAGIKIREKIVSVLMLALITISCNMNVLNFIWHGFHFTNQLPYRFSFIFSFILIVSAYRAYEVLTRMGIKIYQLILLITAPAAVFGLNYYNGVKSDEGFIFDAVLKSSVIITVAYILIFIAVKVIPVKSLAVKRSVTSIFVTAAVIMELSGNANIGVEKVGSSSYTSYPASYENVQKVFDIMHEQDNPLFYRTEMTSTYTLNDSALYGYNGVSQFSSSANVSVTKLFRRLGLYASEAGNRFYYRNSTPVVNMLFGIDYIVSKNGSLNNSVYNLESIGNNGSTYIYKNNYPLSLGFMMNENILELPDKEAVNPFEYQNEIIRLATGLDSNVFTAQPVNLVSYDNMDATKTSYGNYNFKVNDTDKPAKATYSYAGIEDSYLYGYARNGAFDSISVRCDGLSADNSISVKDYPIVFPMGNGQEGSISEINFKISDEKQRGSYTIMAYALKTDAFEQAYEKFADEQLEITEFTDTKITGTINVKEKGILYLSVPYEKGWSVYIDGEKTDTFNVLDSMLGVNADIGRHEVVLEYSPEGFNMGLIVSGISLLLFILFAIIDSKNKRKAVEVEKYEESQSNDSIQGNELPWISEADECSDGSGSSGESGFQGAEREDNDNGLFED